MSTHLPDVFLLVYQMEDGKQYTMTLFGTKEEALKHCENLGLDYGGEVVVILPYDIPTDRQQYH